MGKVGLSFSSLPRTRPGETVRYALDSLHSSLPPDSSLGQGMNRGEAPV